MLQTISLVIQKLQSLLIVKIAPVPKNEEEIVDLLIQMSDRIVEKFRQMHSTIKQKESEYEQLESLVQKHETRNRKQIKTEQQLKLYNSNLKSQLVEQDKTLINMFKQNQFLQHVSRLNTQILELNKGQSDSNQRSIQTFTLDHKLPSRSVQVRQTTLPVVTLGNELNTTSAERRPKRVRLDTDNSLISSKKTYTSETNETRLIKGQLENIEHTLKMRSRKNKLIGILKMRQSP